MYYPLGLSFGSRKADSINLVYDDAEFLGQSGYFFLKALVNACQSENQLNGL